MAKLRSVEKWATRVAQEVPSNPFVPSDNGASPAAPAGGAGNAYGYRDDRGGHGYGGRDGHGGGEGSSSRNITRSMSTPIDPRAQQGRRHSHSHQHQYQHVLHHAQPMPMHPIPQAQLQPQPQPQAHPLAHLKSRSQTHPRTSRDAATSYSSTPTLVAQQYPQQNPQLQHSGTKHRSHSHSRSRSSSRAHSKHSRAQSYAVNPVAGVYGNGGVYSASYANLQDGYRTAVPVPAVPVQYATPTPARIVTVQPGQTCYVNGRRIEYRVSLFSLIISYSSYYVLFLFSFLRLMHCFIALKDALWECMGRKCTTPHAPFSSLDCSSLSSPWAITLLPLHLPFPFPGLPYCFASSFRSLTKLSCALAVTLTSTLTFTSPMTFSSVF